MDVRTGLSIFNKQWLIEPGAAVQMLDMWMGLTPADRWQYKSKEVAETLKFFASAGIGVAPNNSGALREFSFEGSKVAIIPVTGPLMKNDNCGDIGTATMKMLTQMAMKTPSVHTIIFDTDSPGGTVDGTKALADTIKLAKVAGKRTITVADGYMCSAAYWIGSSSDLVVASSVTDIIGSIGTMCSLVDSTAALEKKGYVIREYYADASVDKNKMFADAQKGDGKALIKELLNPMNNAFLGAVSENRGNKIQATTEDVLTGKTYLSEAALNHGLIDGIMSMEDVIADALATGSKKTYSTFIKNTTMEGSTLTLQELKTQHPAAYAAAVKEGADAEFDRVNTILTYVKVDADASVKLIKERGVITEAFREEMMDKKLNAKTLEKMAAGNKAGQTDLPAADQTGDDADLAAQSAERVARFKKRQGV